MHFLTAFTPVLLTFLTNSAWPLTIIQEQTLVDFGEINTHRPKGPFPSAPFCWASDLPFGIAYVLDDFFIKPRLMGSLRMECQISIAVVAWGVEAASKTTLFDHSGVSTGLYKCGGFLSKAHDSYFLCLVYDLFVKMAVTHISCKWPLASWERLGSSAMAFEILMTI